MTHREPASGCHYLLVDDTLIQQRNSRLSRLSCEDKPVYRGGKTGARLGRTPVLYPQEPSCRPPMITETPSGAEGQSTKLIAKL